MSRELHGRSSYNQHTINIKSQDMQQIPPQRCRDLLDRAVPRPGFHSRAEGITP
ncbi:uncharacterized protein RSE6_07706 [Rhynchosporium secalis]|uniref:Uncharacterized protein n=1 Tax=Rhynchosporium secalis TaxID=38038 RepID=A0A1E1MDP8_RHYSE|nr:uncharacterized protein RSE6_07706 [Rhynchosporium secalis]